MASDLSQESLFETDGLDVIVRLHDPARKAELRRAIFSLICQDYRPLKINLITQRFRDDQIEDVQAFLKPLFRLDPTVDFRVWNYTLEEPEDARSALVNLGIGKTSGRYLAILDYDDVIYNDGYVKLIGELEESGCAIAFGKVIMKYIDLFHDALICERQQNRFIGDGLIDLFIENFCPIHSFVVDRRTVDADKLWFDEKLNKLEDYDFLIRLCAEYVSSFRLKYIFVGEYYAKNDGSNTIMLSSAVEENHLAGWVRAREAIEVRRQTSMVSREVQATLTLPVYDPQMTVRSLIESWAGESAKLSKVRSR